MVRARRDAHKGLAIAAFVAATFMGTLTYSAAAAPSIRLTGVGVTGGGGCVGETRVYAATPSAADLKNKKLNPFHTFRDGVAWQGAAGRVVRTDSYVLTTIGCGADRVAIGVNDKTYVLDSAHIATLGMPATYLNDSDPESPRVTIAHQSTLHEVGLLDGQCTLSFRRVRVAIEVPGLGAKVMLGTAVKGC